MSQFDYKKAWKEYAQPGFAGLPTEIQSLIARVEEEATDIKQDRTSLDCIARPALRDKFKWADPLFLAPAARIVYFYGHWGGKADLQQNGTYWKFANLADQALSRYLGIPRDRKVTPIGRSLRVGEGTLIVGLNTPDEWYKVEVGLATEDTLAHINGADWSPNFREIDWALMQRKVAVELRQDCLPRDTYLRGLFGA